MGQLRSDLMKTTRLRFNFQQIAQIVLLQNAVGERTFLSSFGMGRDNFCLFLKVVFKQKMAQGFFILCWLFMDYCPIGFLNLSTAKQFVKRYQNTFFLCKNKHPTGYPIQPMDDAYIGFTLACLKVFLYLTFCSKFLKWTLFADKSCGFVYDDIPFVFVNYFKLRHGFSLRV